MPISTPFSSWRPAGGGRWGKLSPRRSVISLPPYTISTVEFGTASEALILLHGLSGSSAWWSRNVPELCDRYRVILPDLVGFGSSPTVRRLPGPRQSADLVARWMDHLRLERAHLAGHSMGGQVAIHLAAHHPERLDRLVLVDAAGIPRPLSPRELLRFGMEAAPLWRWGDPFFLPEIVRDALSAGPRTILRAISHIVRDDVRPLLEEIRAPTLVIWGERDSLVPLTHAWQLRQQIPEAELAVLRGAAHNPMVDRPADFNRLVLRFLDGERVGR